MLPTDFLEDWNTITRGLVKIIVFKREKGTCINIGWSKNKTQLCCKVATSDFVFHSSFTLTFQYYNLVMSSIWEVDLVEQ